MSHQDIPYISTVSSTSFLLFRFLNNACRILHLYLQAMSNDTQVDVRTNFFLGSTP